MSPAMSQLHEHLSLICIFTSVFIASMNILNVAWATSGKTKVHSKEIINAALGGKLNFETLCERVRRRADDVSELHT